MACEYLEDGKLTRCGAVAGTLIPSHHEREKYCRTDGSCACPTYQLRRLRSEPLPQEAYYALWILQPVAPRSSASECNSPAHVPA